MTILDGRTPVSGLAATLEFAGLRIDTLAHEVLVDGNKSELTGAEFDLLLALASHAPHVVSSVDLLTEMWGTPWRGPSKSLQVHISRLRRKLGEDGRRPRFIHNVHGHGYRFTGEPLQVSDISRLVDPIEFRFDRMLRLRSITPEEIFLGWSPEEVVSNGQLPTPVNPRALALVTRDLVIHGMDSFIQVLPFTVIDGGSTLRKTHVIALRDSHGDFDGFLARVEGAEIQLGGHTGH